MQTHQFNHESGLKVIYEMIESAKTKIGKNYFYYLFWGYLVAATCIIEYCLITVFQFPQHYLVWSILMPLGTITTMVFYIRQRKSAHSKTFIGTAMAYLWSGWLISFLILLLYANLNRDFNLIIPVALAMYGLAIFVSGGMVSFRPLIAAAVVAWVSSIAAFFAAYSVQLIIMASAVILSYVIPGHILKNKSKA